MKIALYRLSVSLLSGSEKTIFELVSRSRHQWTIFTSHYDKTNIPPLPNNTEIIDLKDKWASRQKNIVANAVFNLPRKRLTIKDYDALLVVSVGLEPLMIFRNKRILTACLCFTPLRIVYDPILAKAYTQSKNDNFVKRKVLNRLFRMLDAQAWKHFDHVFCISKEVKKRLQQINTLQNKQIDIIYPGIDINSYNPSLTYDNYFLVPGRIIWTKNIELAINAFKIFRKVNSSGNQFKLVIAGMVDKFSNSYLAKLKEATKDTGGVEFVLSPSENQLNNLYQNAYAILFTALNEDYGIVPLEAMASAKPVIAVNEGGPKDTIENGKSGFLLDATPQSFADTMCLLANDKDLVLRMGENARKHSANFDWKFFVNSIDNFFESSYG